MTYSDKKRENDARYFSEKRCKLTINMTPDQRAQINDFCKDKGGTGTFLKQLIRDEMRKAGIQPLGPKDKYQSK